MKKGVTVAGSLNADVFYEIDTYPCEGFLTNVRDISMNVGGSGNLILDLAKLDSNLTVKVCAAIGEDERGKEAVEILAKFPNIDTENVSVAGKQSAVCMVMNAEDSKQRTFFYIPGSNDLFDISHINFETINTKIFHLEYLLLMKKVDAPDGELGTHAARILREAKNRGMITSIDMVSEQSERAKNVVISALKFTDICCINESEAQTVTGIRLSDNGTLIHKNIPSALKILAEMGVAKWVVIHAPKCGYGYNCETGEICVVPSLNLPKGYIKGSNGAGDAYCSGIVYGAHEDWSLEKAMRLARAAAACSLSENNGTDGMRSAEEALKLEEEFGELSLD